jgi:hypothetical protein
MAPSLPGAQSFSSTGPLRYGGINVEQQDELIDETFISSKQMRPGGI